RWARGLQGHLRRVPREVRRRPGEPSEAAVGHGSGASRRTPDAVPSHGKKKRRIARDRSGAFVFEAVVANYFAPTFDSMPSSSTSNTSVAPPGIVGGRPMSP